MKKNINAILAAIFLLAACAGAPALTPTEAAGEGKSPTASPLPTATQTILSAETPTASLTPSPSITPLPTIPTFTPTFDVRTIVTVTPAAKAECPKQDSSVAAKFATPNSDGSYEFFSADDVLTYLNAGGALAPFTASHAGPVSDTILGTIVDLTGDGVSEVVVRGLVRYDILGCKNGKYQNLFDFATYDFSMDLEDILDLNKDGIPELILYSFSRYGYANVYIIGWDGNSFRSLIDRGTDETTRLPLDSVPTAADYKIMDTNGDGFKEIVIIDNLQEAMDPSFSNFWRPLRNQTITLGWNGKNFVDLTQGGFAPPQYRFQAIQDGDWQTRYGNYAAALSLYREAIFNDRLEWWSPERKDYEVYVYNYSQFNSEPIRTPTPIPDHTEYPRLAAYAYYRIMLLHIVQGHLSDAGTVYKTLQQKFGNNPYGQPYFEMATRFWNAYQSTHRLYDSCAAAIQYAAEHAEILAPLGGDWYYGSQSHTYVPADVCPFR